MLAPKGSGWLYIRKQVQDRVHPTLLHDGFGAYTASGGTRSIAHVLGQRVTMDFHDAIGRDRIEARCRQLSTYLRAQLEELPGIRPMTPADPELSGALLTCALEKADAGAIKKRLLDEHEILVKVAQSTYAYNEKPGITRRSYNALRFSTHVFNSEAEIDRAVEALRPMLASA